MLEWHRQYAKRKNRKKKKQKEIKTENIYSREVLTPFQVFIFFDNNFHVEMSVYSFCDLLVALSVCYVRTLVLLIFRLFVLFVLIDKCLDSWNATINIFGCSLVFFRVFHQICFFLFHLYFDLHVKIQTKSNLLHDTDTERKNSCFCNVQFVHFTGGFRWNRFDCILILKSLANVYCWFDWLSSSSKLHPFIDWKFTFVYFVWTFSLAKLKWNLRINSHWHRFHIFRLYLMNI